MTTIEPGAYGASDSYIVYVICPVTDSLLFAYAFFLCRSNSLVIGKGLLGSQGERHKMQRKMLNPMFSPNRIRDLFPIFENIARDLRDLIDRHIRQGEEEIDLSKYLSRAGLALVAEVGLGHSFGGLEESNEYLEAIKLMECVVSTIRDLLPLTSP